jgi:hypothetical protein
MRFEAELDNIVFRELRETMRAITAAAFALDGFYGTVKARCPPHPHQEIWTQKGTSRKKRITETLRHHLRINQAVEVKQLKSCVSQVFSFRDRAVHLVSKFREVVYRPDRNVAMDWHFAVFRSENSITAVRLAAATLDRLVAALDRGGDELASSKKIARERMNDAKIKQYQAPTLEPRGFDYVGRVDDRSR